ncbi:MAG: DUF115 domain-containing protein [Thermoplasmata archaeon]|nr:DUF115 domain-containing protein [Candidatus Sysuiplasma acidicola]MBX8647030.1 DUF115 domain-containing protein [Candidatus Sysuiplasma acidicola]MDH2905751.1 DUF115 domain-containing protein [Methanomassiliicoccales archaeon]
MKWADWKETYLSILKDFSYSVEREVSASMAAMRATSVTRCLKEKDALGELRHRIHPDCIVCGNSRELEDDIRELLEGGGMQGFTVIAADAAGPRIGRLGVIPDIIVTDMDGEPEAEMEQNRRGTLLLLHFHGDNIVLASDVSKLLSGQFIVTAQSKPQRGVFNFGGFTDGDRSVLLAEEFGARRIVLAGFDFLLPFENGRDGEIKLRKLEWAKAIIEGVRRRGVMLFGANEFATLMETNKKVNV